MLLEGQPGGAVVGHHLLAGGHGGQGRFRAGRTCPVGRIEERERPRPVQGTDRPGGLAAVQPGGGEGIRLRQAHQHGRTGPRSPPQVGRGAVPFTAGRHDSGGILFPQAADLTQPQPQRHARLRARRGLLRRPRSSGRSDGYRIHRNAVTLSGPSPQAIDRVPPGRERARSIPPRWGTRFIPPRR